MDFILVIIDPKAAETEARAEYQSSYPSLSGRGCREGLPAFQMGRKMSVPSEYSDGDCSSPSFHLL